MRASGSAGRWPGMLAASLIGLAALTYTHAFAQEPANGAQEGGPQIFLPGILRDGGGTGPPSVIIPNPCPATSERRFDTIPVASGPIDHPDVLHADLNLTLRGWTAVNVPLGLVHVNGPADADAPQLAGMLDGARPPAFAAAFQIYDWNWGCGEHGCRGDVLAQPEVTLVAIETEPGDAVSAPSRAAEIYGGGYRTLVLYAEPTRITLGYTREDSVAHGYAVHLDGLCVDPSLVRLYQEWNAVGRGSLPALRNDEMLGVTGPDNLLVAVRDRGTFLDPRSRKDWWHDFQGSVCVSSHPLARTLGTTYN